jgi:predicted Zn-dependent protease
MKRTPLSVSAVALLAVLLAGCSSFGVGDVASAMFDPNKRAAVQQAASDTQKAQEDFTPDQEYYIGRTVAATIMSDPRYPPSSNRQVREYLNLLGLSLAWASDVPETFGGWHFEMLDSSEINAFGAPGGFVMVSRELLRQAKSEDEAAAILAHEISHVVLRHGMAAIDKARKTAALTSIVKAGVLVAGSAQAQQLTATFGDVVGDIVKTMVNKGYSRELEYQADAAAVVLLDRAGYDPMALVRLLQTMQSHWKTDGPGFMKTHPSPADRIAAVRQVVAGLPPAAAVAASALSARQARFKAAFGKL